MNKTLTRLFTVALLMMVSMGARADVKVLFGEKGTELQAGKDGTITLGQKELTGGTIIISQVDQKDGTSKVTFAVTPGNGYQLAENGLEVYAVIPPGISPTRGLEVSTTLTLKSEDFKDEDLKRTYTTTIDSKLALWLKSANFQPQKRDGAKGTPETESGWNGDGYYYIINNNTTYYLKPATTYYQNNTSMPFLTTNTTGQVPGSLWIIKTNGDYKQIIHAVDGKYVTTNGSNVPNQNHRRRMHLESKETPGDDNDFVLEVTDTKYNIRHKTMVEGSHKYWNPSGGNQTYDDGGSNGYSGIIGLFNSATDAGSLWTLTFVKKCVTPEITVDGSGNVTITSVTSEATIYYTNDDTDPATSDTKQTYSASFSLGTATRIRAIAIKDDFTNSDEATYSAVQCKTPTIVLNKENGLTTITPHADNSGAAIYYTTDGSDPTISSTRYEGPFTLPLEATGIKAIASESADGSDASEVVEYVLTKLALPTFSKNGATVTINKPTKDTNGTNLEGAAAVEIHYNQNNNDPTSSSTLYNAAITLPENFNQTIIKARAYKAGYVQSDVASLSIEKCAKPVILNNYDGTFTLSCATGGAKITYTTSTSTSAPSDPTPNSTEASSPITVPEGTKIIKVRAFKAGLCLSDVLTYNLPVCPAPTIKNNSGQITIIPKLEGSAIKYSTSSEGTPDEDYNAPFSLGSATIVRAYAKHAGYIDSEITTWIPATVISSASDVTNLSGNYIINGSFSGSLGTEEAPFTGTIDGQCVVISGRSEPLVVCADGATIKNVILDNVTISGDANVGAICNVAKGATRIYNCGVLATNSSVKTDDDGYTVITSCSSTISGSGNVGGIVGKLDGSSRVINCFSYANIINGNLVGGIVGNNNVASTSENQKTMVMNCMFYGDIDVDNCTSKAPIYNGKIITNRNDKKGVSNFNYFWAGASYVQGQKIDVYNCALSAETRYLQRFEFFRPLLNSNRALAAWWATDNRDNKDEMLKWVLEPSQIGSKTPYPILKAVYDNENKIIKYPSVVNIDAANAEPFASNAAIKKTQYNQGRKFGTLTITIQNASSGAPNGANIEVTSVTPNITDKDPAHFNFNYYKVQLPYYNDVGTKNYTGNKVVTGWKIVSMSTSAGSFTTGSDATATADANGNISLTTPYNFADRNCTAKDIYSDTNKRVFSQGAYFDVPDGVTSIIIEPYWGKCVYVSDQYPDVVYNQAMTSATNVTTVGGGARFTNGQPSSINGVDQLVYTTMGDAITALNPSGSVYDNAIVLVGNVHYLVNTTNKATDHNNPYTIMSIDLDKDNEPDYSYIFRLDGRVRVHPVRVDFLNVIGLGMAQKSADGTGTYNIGIMQPLGWFEVTNTGLFRVTQLEYDYNDTRIGGASRANSPVILQGGVIEQWVTVGGRENVHKEAKSVSYYHVGGNVWFKEFHIGVHQDKNLYHVTNNPNPDEFISPHPPISVTGGDFKEFYLTGLYNTPNANYDDNAECYINGGRFGKVAGTGMQGIGVAGRTPSTDDTGNIIWQIDNADIDEFYAGGINAAHIATGNITTVISNSRVDQFCGGPKFGDMNSGKKVVTNATNCTFRTFFGAGYGGNSYNRRYPDNQNNKMNIDWNDWVSKQYTKKYDSSYGGVETRIDYQFLPMSGNADNVCRLFVDYVSFSLATTRSVTSILTDCTITTSPLGSLKLFDGCVGNFYGGGSLGKVEGPVNSTLTNCTVEGNVYGAGYSATLPPVDVMDQSFVKEPYYDKDLGAFFEAKKPLTTSYTWEHKDEVNSTGTAINIGTTRLFTTENLDKSNLGSVNGPVTLTIGGDSKIGTDGDQTGNTGNVFGGGDESYVVGSANKITVTLKGNANVLGNVFGGGDEGLVEGSTEVNIVAE